MKYMKYAIALVAVAIIGLGIGVWTATPGDALYALKLTFGGETTYVNAVDAAVSDLEDSLDQVAADVANGTLDATTAQQEITARLAAVSQSVTAAQASNLSDSALVTLQLSLARFAHTLQSYSETLIAVDTEVMVTGDSEATSTLTAAFETLNTVSEHLTEAIDTLSEDDVIPPVELVEPDQTEGEDAWPTEDITGDEQAVDEFSEETPVDTDASVTDSYGTEEMVATTTDEVSE